jgi:DNA mismatch repair protein MutS
MAGKSTYMRQTALIVLMAQVGSFVPADYAEIGVCDRIFTRVGASDDLATGQSTFMVEMTEVANILNNATKNSLVLLDEIGRGTSTFDGLAIAWSVLEHIAPKLGAFTLFATHYHELTQLEGSLPGVKNYCFTAQEQGENIVFLRKLIHGEAGQSYGIHVARLAGLPQNVLEHANDLLEQFNKTSGVSALKPLSLFEKSEAKTLAEKPEPSNKKMQALVQELAGIEVEKITPLQAIVALGRLKEMI